MGMTKWLLQKITHQLEESVPDKPSYLCSFDRISHEVKTADVLLIEGQNWVSKMIQRITLSPWSHAVLYIGRLHDIEDRQVREQVHKHYQGPPSDQLVVESILGKGTIITPLRYYRNSHIRICRPAGLAHSDAQHVVAYASKSLGKEYSLRHLLDLGRFLLKSKLIPGRWRSSLFDNNPNKSMEEICSAMIAHAFSEVKFPILPLIREDQSHHLEFIHRNPRLFTPSDFDYSPYFNIIKYPIIPLHTPGYRSLPWNENLTSPDDETITHKNGN